MSKFIVAKPSELIAIEGADLIQAARVCGELVVVSKAVTLDDVGIFFPVDCQVSEEYVKLNNLFRHSHLNADNTKTGFFEDNRRVKAVTLRKVKSCGYFAPMDSLAFAGQFDYVIGQQFDEINGKQICCKYVSQATRDAINRAAKNGIKQPKKNTVPFFEKHVDSSQFKQNVGMIPVGALIHVHAKIHGTSHRSGLTLIKLALPKWKEFVNKFLSIFQTEKWDYVVGTRNCILSDGSKEGFHGSEQFRFDVAETLKPFMVKGMTVYGEIAGYTNGKPVMAVHNSKDTKDKAFTKKYGEKVVYKYGCNEAEYRFHIYRITMLNYEGQNVDFTEAQLEQWVAERNLLGPLNICEPFIYDGDVEALCQKVEQLTERPELLGEDYVDPTMPGEGVILRIDTGKMNPYFLKNKAYYFKCMESLCEAIDIESVEALSE